MRRMLPLLALLIVMTACAPAPTPAPTATALPSQTPRPTETATPEPIDADGDGIPDIYRGEDGEEFLVVNGRVELPDGTRLVWDKEAEDFVELPNFLTNEQLEMLDSGMFLDVAYRVDSAGIWLGDKLVVEHQEGKLMVDDVEYEADALQVVEPVGRPDGTRMLTIETDGVVEKILNPYSGEWFMPIAGLDRWQDAKAGKCEVSMEQIQKQDFLSQAILLGKEFPEEAFFRRMIVVPDHFGYPGMRLDDGMLGPNGKTKDDPDISRWINDPETRFWRWEPETRCLVKDPDGRKYIYAVAGYMNASRQIQYLQYLVYTELETVNFPELVFDKLKGIFPAVSLNGDKIIYAPFLNEVYYGTEERSSWAEKFALGSQTHNYERLLHVPNAAIVYSAFENNKPK